MTVLLAACDAAEFAGGVEEPGAEVGAAGEAAQVEGEYEMAAAPAEPQEHLLLCPLCLLAGNTAVCGDDNETYGNACWAACHEAEVIHTGACGCGDGYAGPGEACDDGNAIDTDDCTNACTPAPRSCQELLAHDPAATSGPHLLDLDGQPSTAKVAAYCDMTTEGGGWTIFYAATGADGEPPMVSDAPVAGDPLQFQAHNLDRQAKIQLGDLASETLFVRPGGVWLRADAPAFDADLAVPDSDSAYPVTLTAAGADGEERSGFMGWSNHDIAHGGDFGVTLSSPGDGFWEIGGFDHHLADYWMLNDDCVQQILYSYSRTEADGDAGYDAIRSFGAWTATPLLCRDTRYEGGQLVFYAAMR